MLCWPDGPLFKYPSSQHFKYFWMFNTKIYSYLQFDIIDYAPKPGTAETACREPSNSSLNGISQNKTLCALERQIYKWIKFHFTSYVHHTLHCLAGYFFFPPHKKLFPPVCVFWNTRSLPGRFCLGPLGVASLAVEGQQNLTWLYSGLLISGTFLPHAGSSCTLE
jgi:hypothetical protein